MSSFEEGGTAVGRRSQKPRLNKGEASLDIPLGRPRTTAKYPDRPHDNKERARKKRTCCRSTARSTDQKQKTKCQWPSRSPGQPARSRRKTESPVSNSVDRPVDRQCWEELAVRRESARFWV